MVFTFATFGAICNLVHWIRKVKFSFNFALFSAVTNSKLCSTLLTRYYFTSGFITPADTLSSALGIELSITLKC